MIKLKSQELFLNKNQNKKYTLKEIWWKSNNNNQITKNYLKNLQFTSECMGKCCEHITVNEWIAFEWCSKASDLIFERKNPQHFSKCSPLDLGFRFYMFFPCIQNENPYVSKLVFDNNQVWSSPRSQSKISMKRAQE